MESVGDTDSYSTDYSKAFSVTFRVHIYITLLAFTITFGRHLVTAILIQVIW